MRLHSMREVREGYKEQGMRRLRQAFKDLHVQVMS
jgi:hypothetical protein